LPLELARWASFIAHTARMKRQSCTSLSIGKCGWVRLAVLEESKEAHFEYHVENPKGEGRIARSWLSSREFFLDDFLSILGQNVLVLKDTILGNT